MEKINGGVIKAVGSRAGIVNEKLKDDELKQKLRKELKLKLNE